MILYRVLCGTFEGLAPPLPGPNLMLFALLNDAKQSFGTSGVSQHLMLWCLFPLNDRAYT